MKSELSSEMSHPKTIVCVWRMLPGKFTQLLLFKEELKCPVFCPPLTYPHRSFAVEILVSPIEG